MIGLSVVRSARSFSDETTGDVEGCSRVELMFCTQQASHTALSADQAVSEVTFFPVLMVENSLKLLMSECHVIG